MARINFPLGFDEIEKLPKTRRLLQNCWNSGSNAIIQRPGIQAIAETGRVARGQFVWNENLYQVVSNDLIKIVDTETGAFDVIGTIEGANPIETDFGFNTTVIVAKDEFVYTLDDSDTLTDITNNTNFVPVTDVAYINGRYVYIPTDGDPAFFSDVGAAGTVQADSFFDAEELPDKNNAVFNFKNTLYICGTDSIELFRDTGASPNPFLRVNGARITNGYIGGLLEYNETFLFIGREKGQDYGIYAIGQGIAPKISNHGIDLLLSTYSQDELTQAVSGRLKWRGYDIATFTLARDSFGFYAGNWFKLDTVFNGVSKPWGAGFIIQFEGEYFTAFSDQIGKFAAINTDYGNPITKIIDLGFEQEDNDFFACQSIELGMSQGFNSAVGSVAIFLSRDNVTYSDPFFRETGKLAEYDKKLKWNYPGGLGSYDGFMGVRIYTVADVHFSSSFITADIRS